MLFLIVTATTEFTVCPEVAGTGREEVACRELDLSKGVAGLFVGVVALLFRDAEIVHGNEHLNVSDNLNDCEESEGNVNGRCAAGKLGNYGRAYTVAD